MKRFLILATLLAAFTISTVSAATPNSPTEQSEKAKKSAVLTVTNDNFEQLASENRLLVIDFWASWCGPCRAIAPIIEELAQEYKGKVAIGKCNVDENRSLTTRFEVQGIPAIFLMKNGKIVDTQIGYCTKEQLKAKIERLAK